MDTGSKIIILRGNSGSGKSTVAKKLQKKLGYGAFLIPQDVVRREMLWVKDGENTKAIPLLINLIQYGRENCEYVILEGIFYSDWYKDVFWEVSDEYGSNVFAYYYDVPFEETLKRHQTRTKCNEFGEEEMRKWWREKDYIGFIPEKRLNKDMDADAVVEMILQDIQYRERGME